jgi:ribosomal protein S18 acetylase RimI-like enzyme
MGSVIKFNMNYTTKTLNGVSSIEIENLTHFLYHNLDEYGDTKSAIRKAIEYAAKERSGLGGYLFTIENKKEIVGAVVVNKTGMDEYIPENILVYIAVHKEHRGEGLGKKLMEYTIENCKGDIALHVEADNPAKHLYAKYGFENPYLEMRLKRKEKSSQEEKS